MRVLIVEDDPLVGSLFERILSEEGYVISLVRTGRDAIRQVSDSDCYLGIVDMSLPDMDGAYAIQLILSERPYMKILAVSGMLVEGMEAIALRAGAAAVLAKPASPNELRAAVFHLIDPTDRWMTITV